MSTANNPTTPAIQTVSPPFSNTVAMVGVALTGVTVLLCGLLFWLVSQLPDGVGEFRRLQDNTPAQTRLLVIGCSTAVLNFVALVLCIVGLVLPKRPRFLAMLGALASGLILIGVFGVLIVGAMLNPVDSTPTTLKEADAPTVQP